MIEGNIPVVDLEDFFSDEKRDIFIKEVGSALEDIGFFAVKNHSIGKDLLEAVYSASTSFFNLSLNEKKKYERPDILRQRGYTSFGQEHAKGSSSPDLKEFYMVTNEEVGNSDNSPFGPNIWPKEVPKLKDTSLIMFNYLDNLSRIILQCCAFYIGEKADFFTNMANNSDTILRIIHYPPLGSEAPSGSIRSGAHEDINLITLLCSSTARGLELLQRNGEWLSVETGTGYVIVDSGDMIQNITNGLFRSTTHRVVNPPEITQRRFSFPFFVHPRKEINLSPMESCVSKTGGVKKYPNISAGEYLNKRLKEIGVG